MWDKKLIEFSKLQTWFEAAHNRILSWKYLRTLVFMVQTHVWEKRKEERRKGRWRRRKTSLVIKSSWGTGYGEGKSWSGANLAGFPKRRTSLVNAFMLDSVSGWTDHLSLLFKICLFKITMMSLSISQALLPFRVSFRFQDCCHCVCHSPLQATRDVYLDAGEPRSRPPRKGWSESLVCAVEGSSSVRVTRFTHHTLLSRDSDSHLPSVRCKALLRLFSTPLPKNI